MKYAFFVISGKTFAGPMSQFRELREPSPMRDLPEDRSPFVGWATDKDKLCTVVDFSPFFGGAKPSNPMWLVLDEADHRLCIVIDGPAIWREIDEAQVVKKPSSYQVFPQEYLEGLIEVEGQPPVPLVDIRSFLKAGDLAWIREQIGTSNRDESAKGFL